MARVEITWCQAGGTSTESSAPMPVAKLSGAVTEVVTSSGTSAKTTLTSSVASSSGFVIIYSAGDVWAVAGPSLGLVAAVPTSGDSGAGMRIPANIPASLAVNLGDAVAIIDIV